MSKKIFVCIFACYCIFFVTIPPFQLNDEPDHFQYVFWLARGIFPQVPRSSGMPFFDKNVDETYNVMEVVSNDNNIPEFSKIKSAREKKIYFNTLFKTTPLTYQAHHPPLYHLLASVLFRIADKLFQSLIPIFYTVRLTSTIFYCLTVFIAWNIAHKLIRNKKIADYLTVVFAINPVTLKMGVALNPDIAAACLALSVLLVFLSYKNKPITVYFLIRITILLTIGAYIKFQNLVFFPFVFFILLVRGIRKNQIKTYVLKGIAILVCGFFLFLPWLIHSYATTQSLTPSSVVYTFFCTQNNPSYSWYSIPLHAFLELRHAVSHFAGFLGWGEPYPFKPFFIGYTIFFTVFLVGGIVIAIRTKMSQWIIFLFPHAGFITLFFYGVSLTYKINRYSCDIQGRYLLPALFPFVLLIWKGIIHFTGWKKQTVAYGMFLFALWQFLFILFYVLIPRYYV